MNEGKIFVRYFFVLGDGGKEVAKKIQSELSTDEWI